MKKFISLVLAIMMLVSCVCVSATAADEAQVLHFDTTKSGWTDFTKVFCHMWVYGGDSFAPWQSKKEACTDTDGDGIWTYDITAKLKTELEEGQLYVCIFSNNNNQQIYDLLFDTTVFGDTAYGADFVYENPEDSSKTAQAAFWEGQDPAVFGPAMAITSIGNVVGTCIPNVTTAQEIFESFLANTEKLDNVRTYSMKADQAILDDIAIAMGLTVADIETAIANTAAVVEWNAADSTAPQGGTDPTEPEPTEPEPTEPEPTEPEPTEPEPTEPEPTEPEPTEPEPTEPFNPADHTWTAVGAIAPGHTEGGCLGAAWNPAYTDNDLTFDEATGLWSKTYTDVAATGETEDFDDTWYEYKVAADHDWAISFNENGDALGDGTNAKFDVEKDGSTVTIYFDGTKCWAVVEYELIDPPMTGPTDPEPTQPEPTTDDDDPTEPEPTEPEPTEPFNPADHTWTAVGAIAPGHTDGGCLGAAWNVTNADNDLTYDEATGLWSITYTDVAATGETDDYDDTWYEYKVAADHDWALSFNDTGDALGDGTNAKFDVEEDGSTVTIYFDGTKCWAVVEAPEVPVRQLGDVDNDGEVSIMDVTAIQMHLAKLETLDEEALSYADVNGDGYVTILDGTEIQLLLAGITEEA